MKKTLSIAISFCLATTLLSACGQEQSSPDQASQAAQISGEISALRPEAMTPYATRPITEDVMYFVMPDRFFNGDESNDTGGFSGGPNDHGFDPTHKGFFHGGDFKGLTAKLDYLADMGISAIWLTPIFKNKPTQGNAVNITAGYHGYWITDFTQIDPHLGTNDDLKTLVEEAHSRNIKVIFDIITNHTADVIKYEECYPQNSSDQNVPICDYRSKEDYPYTTKGKEDGPAINPGFAGDDVANQTSENFAKLTDQTFAYTPYVPGAEKNVKVPAWLNDAKYYHNRGDSEWKGESSLYGDFAGLDDLFTEHPDVVKGMIDIYKFWISEFKIDGFRIDTVRHVNDSFWQTFSPAIEAHAIAEGIEQFYIFGEVYDPNPERLSHFTTVAKLPAVLDFGFQSVATQVVAEGNATSKLADFYAQDVLYKTETSDASTLPTFLGNHDMGRIGLFITKANPKMSKKEALQRAKLAHALMFYTRGVPVIYYGDEQGFIGDGHDQDARENMFASQVASYNDNSVIGSEKNAAYDNFDTKHPLYNTIKRLAAVRGAHSALQGGDQTILVSDDEKAGAFVFTRTDARSGNAVLVAINSATTSTKAVLPASMVGQSLCFLDGAKGDFENEGEHLNYTAPALSWAVFDLAECQN